MPGRLPFLDSEHPIYKQWHLSWERDEGRHFGGDAILDELTPFRNEGDDSKLLRRRTARYTNFPDMLTTKVVGHLSTEAPEYSYGALGPAREMEDIKGQPGLHEIFHYNCDGIGSDGSQYPAWRDGVKRRACVTGVRWVMAEMPSAEDLADIRRRLVAEGGTPVEAGTPVSKEEEKAGYRVFLREYSPIDVHNWKFVRGVLQWAIIWIPLERDDDLDDMNEMREPLWGRYLLVRKGYEGLGQEFAVGGWWTFDQDHEPVDHASGWEDTRGEIPLWRMFAVKDEGTAKLPAMGRSLTMEVGQIAIDLMNCRSEQRYNLRQAAKTILYFLGIEGKQHTEVVEQLEGQSIAVAVPPVMLQDGTVGIPQIWCSSSAVVDAGAFQIVLDAGMDEAKEVMIKQVTSTPDSSGESKKAGFDEATSPLLRVLAETSEEFDNTMLYFVLQLLHQQPTATVTWPRDFPLRDLVDDLKTMFDLLKQVDLSSPTLELKAIEQRATELRLMDDATEAEQIKQELKDSVKAREDRKSQEAGVMGSLIKRPPFDPAGNQPAPPAPPPGGAA